MLFAPRKRCRGPVEYVLILVLVAMIVLAAPAAYGAFNSCRIQIDHKAQHFSYKEWYPAFSQHDSVIFPV